MAYLDEETIRPILDQETQEFFVTDFLDISPDKIYYSRLCLLTIFECLVLRFERFLAHIDKGRPVACA